MDREPKDSCRPRKFDLFSSFLKLGAMAFGGPAMVAHVRRLAVEEKRWILDSGFRDGIALAQSVPGPTAMQVAAYVGLKTRGYQGAVISYVAFGMPSFLFMLVLSILYVQGQSIPVMGPVFSGLRAITIAIMAHAAVSFGMGNLRRMRAWFLFVVSTLLFLLRVNPILIIVLSALLAALYFGKNMPAGSGAPSTESFRFCPLLLIAAVPLVCAAFLFFGDQKLFEIMAVMMRIDLFAFGGGYTAFSLMFFEVVEKAKWVAAPALLNGIALGQVTPGPIVITAIFVGYVVAGIAGALAATIGIFSPSFIVLLAVEPIFGRLRSSAAFSRALDGILASFVGLLAAVTIQFAMNIYWRPGDIVITSLGLIALFLKVPLYWLIPLGIGLSIIWN